MNPKQATSAVTLVGWGLLTVVCWAESPVKLDDALSTFGRIESDFRISSDGSHVIYRAIHNAGEARELYCVASTGGTPITLSGALGAGGEVSSWQLTLDGSLAVYWADGQQDGLTEIYAVSTAGGSPLKLNAPLVDVGSIGGAIVGDRVVYIGSQETSIFFEPYFELFSVPSDGGQAERLNGPLVAGGDVRSVVARADAGRVVYLADQDADEVVELYSVSASGGPPTKLNPPLVADGDVSAAGLQFSPNGNRVLYAANQEQSSTVEVFSVPTLGGPSVKLNGLLAQGGNVTPGSQRFSPDGTRVLYRADQNADEVFEIFSVASTGGSPVQLNGGLVTNGDVRQHGLQFSPDGTRVLYTADQDVDEQFELYSVPSLGGVPVRLNGELVVGGDVFDDAVFSPAGGHVLYRADQAVDGTIELYNVPSGGGAPIRLNENLAAGGSVVRASFSPDGSQVVYLADQQVDEVFELFAVASGGGAARKISGPMTDGGDVVDWQFSLDGSLLVYRADQDVDGTFELYAVRLNEGLPGDFNDDGVVDAADYTVWRDGLGATYSADDYGVWKSNFGASAGAGSAEASSSASAVPEPGTWLLMGSAFTGVIRRGRRRERRAR